MRSLKVWAFTLLLAPLISLSQNKTSLFLQTQYNATLYDATEVNNPSGIGLGLQGFLNNQGKIKPTIEATFDAYPGGKKVAILNPDDTMKEPVDGMINLFAGASWHPKKSIFLSFTAGPSFIGGETYLGIKPTLGFHFGKQQRWMGKASFINVYNRDALTEEDFGSLSFSIGIRLF
jgi:hypothetical protein